MIASVLETVAFNLNLRIPFYVEALSNKRIPSEAVRGTRYINSPVEPFILLHLTRFNGKGLSMTGHYHKQKGQESVRGMQAKKANTGRLFDFIRKICIF